MHDSTPAKEDGVTTDVAAYLADLTWKEVEERAERVPYWLLVAGSVEQHGPHLPLSADTLVVERLAELASARHGSVILGSIRVGVLYAYQDWPGTQRVSPEVLTGQFTSLAALATRYSNRLMVLNGHDENHEVIMTAARELVEHQGTDVVVVEWAQLVKDVIRKVSESTSETHAGEGLTSVFLHWYPERVRTGSVAPGRMAESGLTREDLHATRRADHIRRVSREYAPSGVLGDPTLANAVKGAEIADALVDRVDQLARERGWL
jgi:creatinine amidohydrolase/Fe(II)-dependent formamide hydrolase-like protein